MSYLDILMYPSQIVASMCSKQTRSKGKKERKHVRKGKQQNLDEPYPRDERFKGETLSTGDTHSGVSVLRALQDDSTNQGDV